MRNTLNKMLLLICSCLPLAGCVQASISSTMMIAPGHGEPMQALQLRLEEIDRMRSNAVPDAAPALPMITHAISAATESQNGGSVSAVSQITSIEAMTDAAFAKLAPTVNMSFAELVGDNGDYDDPAAFPAPGTFHVVVDIAHQVVMVYKEDGQGGYTVPVRYMICSTGSKKNPTRRGTFETGSHKVRFGYFVNDHVYGQYWTHVVSRTYFHSLLYTQRNANTYTTSSYKNLGSRASHGCIRLLVPDARWMYYHLAPGSTVEIRKGDSDDIETAAIKARLTFPSLPKQRPGLQQGEIPHTDNWEIATYLRHYSKTAPYVK